MKKYLKMFAIIGTVVYLQLLIFDNRLLMSEVRVKVGQEYFADGYGNLGKNSQDSLVCYYFNGRKVFEKVYWYSSNNIMGRDSCKFLIYNENEK